jgi:hypothetical protein
MGRQGKPSSFSSKLRSGGRDLLYAHPVTGSGTFRPSGKPKDPPYVAKRSTDEYARRLLGVHTPQGRDAWDDEIRRMPNGSDYLRRVLEEGGYWERIRFQVNKSPRARKRALEREARRECRPKDRS